MKTQHKCMRGNHTKISMRSFHAGGEMFVNVNRRKQTRFWKLRISFEGYFWLKRCEVLRKNLLFRKKFQTLFIVPLHRNVSINSFFGF